MRRGMSSARRTSHPPCASTAIADSLRSTGSPSPARNLCILASRRRVMHSRISRRAYLQAAAGVLPAAVLAAQDLPAPGKPRLISMQVLVFDERRRFVNGLGPTDFRVFEDRILQTIFTFAEGDRPSMP